jgi:lipopolysaccharide transport system ATP-binding protein
MSKAVISVENVSKRYFVGHKIGPRERYSTLRAVISGAARNFSRTALDFVRGRQIVQGDEIEEFWALKNISFEVKAGEVLGIIGRNGAGKSTLLKILSRITEPTAGRIRLLGRVGSLLEVGTGFHNELTGRENIFLNGAILGMQKAEISKRFEEIVDFSGVEQFIDTPVKRYSSGMYVRLAFSVAAHLQTDILIVDEVLAVGDQEFQQKCLGKMHDATSKEGRTAIFVSHNLSAVSSLTRRAVLLDSGRIVINGNTASAVASYLSKLDQVGNYTRPKGRTSRTPHIRRAEVITSEPNGVHRYGKPLEVRFWIQHDTPMRKACFSFNIVNQFEQAVVHAWIFHDQVKFGSKAGETVLICKFSSPRINVGRFHLRTHLTGPPGGENYEHLDGICLFEVIGPEITHLWGWHPEDCAYHEDWSWDVASEIDAGCDDKLRSNAC